MIYDRRESEIHCPIECGLAVFGSKWKSRILCILEGAQAMRYSELRRHLINVSDAALASSLKELTALGLVSRTEVRRVPSCVEYRLTQKGISVIPVIDHICKWALNQENCTGFSTSSHSSHQPVCSCRPCRKISC